MSKKRRIVFIASLVIMALGIGYVTYYFTQQAQRGKIYDDLQSAVSLPSEVPSEIESSLPSAPSSSGVEKSSLLSSEPESSQEEKPPYVSPIDFDSLWEITTDIYAWIRIPDTVVDYPIVQGKMDDSYYLNHTVEGYAGYPGSIFTYRINKKDFSDFNTLIYGHDMLDGSMFGSLSKYRDMDYLKDHREIHIYTPEKEMTYQIFAAVVYDDRLITSYFDNEDPEDCRAFLESLREVRYFNSYVLDDVEVTEEDKIITLSTCIGGLPYNRYLIAAVLVDEIT